LSFASSVSEFDLWFLTRSHVTRQMFLPSKALAAGRFSTEILWLIVLISEELNLFCGVRRDYCRGNGWISHLRRSASVDVFEAQWLIVPDGRRLKYKCRSQNAGGYLRGRWSQCGYRGGEILRGELNWGRHKTERDEGGSCGPGFYHNRLCFYC